MPHHKTARIAPSIRRKSFVANAGPLAPAMRPCKNCVASHQPCQMSDTSEKCMGCNASGRSCDLYVPPVVIQRLHRERMKLRKQVRDARAAVAREGAKLARLEQQLEHIEDREEELISTEWRNIQELEAEEATRATAARDPLLPFDVSSEQFQLPTDFDWSSVPLPDLGEIVAEGSGNSQDSR